METGKKEPTIGEEGQAVLDRIGLGYVGNRTFMLDGVPTEARNFLQHPKCAMFVRLAMNGLSELPKDDPDAKNTIEALRGVVAGYVDITPEARPN